MAQAFKTSRIVDTSMVTGPFKGAFIYILTWSEKEKYCEKREKYDKCNLTLISKSIHILNDLNID